MVGAKWIRTAGPAGFSSKSGVLCQFRFLRRRWPALTEKNGTDRKWPLSLEQAGTGGSNPFRSTIQSVSFRTSRRIDRNSICTISEDIVDPKDPAYTDLPQISSEDIEAVSGDLGPLRTAREKGVISVNFLVQPGELLFSENPSQTAKSSAPRIQGFVQRRHLLSDSTRESEL
jgi:hypothetical protein